MWEVTWNCSIRVVVEAVIIAPVVPIVLMLLEGPIEMLYKRGLGLGEVRLFISASQLLLFTSRSNVLLQTSKAP
ncbi:hypothetical protein Hanom_Chr00s053436g01781121 [Helianthus anomalus]